MSTDCFGNPTPGIPPSISDTFADIQTYRDVPYTLRAEYHRARVNAMIGRGSADDAWALLRRVQEARR